MMSKHAQQGLRDAGPARVEFSPRELIEAIGSSLVDGDNSPEEIRRHIDDLQEMVRGHFAAEADEEIFEEAVFQAPWLTPLAECLRQQGEALGEMVDQLISLARSGDGSHDWRQQVRVRFEEFADLFFEHDAGVRSLLHSKEDWREE